MIRFLFSFVFFIAVSFTIKAQVAVDSMYTIRFDTIKNVKKFAVIDSAAQIRKAFVADSLTYLYLKPDPKRENPYFKQLEKDFIISDPYLISSPSETKIVKNNYGLGLFIKKSPKIFVYIFLFILIFFGIVRTVFEKELKDVFKAFYDNRFLAQINKDENYLVSWQFLFLFVILALSTGLFICILLFKLNGNQSVTQLSTLLIYALVAFVFYILKVFVLKLLGNVFLIQKLTKDYINIIYLSYFNSLFLLLPIILCLILMDINQKNYIIEALLMLFSLVFGIQFIRIAINILLNYRLSKFYLILYLCTLEICPLILFAKTINTSL